MTHPIIAITAGRIVGPAASSELQMVTTGCDVDYVDAIVRAGGAPFVIPRHANIEAVRAVVALADGLLVTGGGDICSLLYGEEPHASTKYQDPIRDGSEIVAIQSAASRGVPVLGICRGLQILNVAFGGTLIQDIPSRVPGAVLHDNKGLVPVEAHTIDIEPGTLLENLLETRVTTVNSYHHQSADRIGDGLRVNARARDGVVEGLELADGGDVLAVQYHPEELARDEARFQVYFNWLIKRANQFKIDVRSR